MINTITEQEKFCTDITVASLNYIKTIFAEKDPSYKFSSKSPQCSVVNFE